MRKRARHASTPIYNENDHEISDSQKQHFTRMGYKPYLSYRGKVKWLSFEQHIYEKIKYAPKQRPSRTRTTILGKHRKQKWYRHLYRAFLNNWLLLSVLAFVIGILLFYDPILTFLSRIIK
jgi:hypothetical protein